MNILYLAHRVPFPPDKGDKIRSFRELEYLARRHSVWCACFVDTPSDEQFVGPLNAYCRDTVAVRINRRRAAFRGLAGMIRGKTVTESFYTHARMRRALRDWCSSIRFDAVVAFSSSMADYALQVPADRHVLDLCDLDSRKWIEYAAFSSSPARWIYRAEGRRLALRERAWMDRFDATIVVSEAETPGDGGQSESLYVVSNGVTLPDKEERPLARGLTARTPRRSVSPGDCTPASDQRRPRAVGFVGVMDYKPNVDAVCRFVSHCWPRIRAVYPNTVFRIVGRSPARRVRGLASVPGVEVAGEVEDATAHVRRFDVSVAPMRIGRGVQNKVLEAMAAARPVVLTRKAAEGIAGRHQREFIVADDAQEIVDSVLRLLSDPAERKRLGTAARRFVAVHHCWEDKLRTFELIVTGLMERTARRAELERAATPVQAVPSLESASACPA